MRLSSILEEVSAHKIILIANDNTIRAKGAKEDVELLAPLLRSHKHLLLEYLQNKIRFKDSYEERAAIYQYDAGYSEQEAENLAFKDIMLEYISSNYPEIIAEVEKIIFNHSIN